MVFNKWYRNKMKLFKLREKINKLNLKYRKLYKIVYGTEGD